MAYLDEAGLEALWGDVETLVGEVEVTDGSITTAKIADGAVTDDKLASSGIVSVVDYIDDLYELKNVIQWQNGYYSANGTYTNQTQYSNRCTISPIRISKPLLIRQGANRRWCVCRYSKTTGEFIDRTEYTQDAKTLLSPEYDYNICIATVGSGNYSTELLLSEMSFLYNGVYSDILDTMTTHTMYIENGWAGATTYPSDNYAYVPNLTFYKDVNIKAKSGYELAIINNQQSAVYVPWFSEHVMGNTISNACLLMRKDGGANPIIKSIDGYTLASYCENELFITGLNETYVLNDMQLNYVKTEVLKEISSKWHNKKAAFIGDSITAGVGTTDGNIYYQLLNNNIGFSSIYVSAIAGSCYSVTSNYGSSPQPITQRISSLPTDCDLVVIFAGTNDWGHNTPLGTIADTTDISFYGALSVVVNSILENNPDVRLALMTPLHRWGYSGTYPNDTDQNGQGLTLKDYVDAIKKVGEMYGVPIVDTYSMACLNPRIGAIKTAYVPDGLHPNGDGHHLLANRINPIIENLW